MLASLFNKIAALQGCNFIKKRLQHRCLPVKFVKSILDTYFKEHLRATASRSSDLVEFCENAAVKDYVKLIKEHACKSFLKVSV